MDLRSQPALLISFSGLDGAGKSTQVEQATALLESFGLRVQRLVFWEEVAVLTRCRAEFVHQAYRSERGIGGPGRPVERRDKNVHGWYLTPARHCFYLLDTLHLRRVVARARSGGANVVLMDRYIYDELVNLPLNNRLCRLLFRFVVWLAPKPELALLLDADPEAARARKPEYPVEFLQQCRSRYLRMARQLGTITVVPPLALSEAQHGVAEAIRGTLAQAGTVAARFPRSA